MEQEASVQPVSNMANQKAVAATVSGKWVDYLNMRPMDINIWDIAWPLSQINRFTGQTPVPWSVLSHTGLCFLLMKLENPNANPVDQLAVLLHDASEAYLGDVIKPIKVTAFGETYRDMEDELMSVIFKRFGIAEAITQETFEMIKRYDNQALALEYDKLFPTLRGDPYVPKMVYPMEKPPVLIAARPEQFIEIVKYLAINCNVPDVQTLFTMPGTLKAYVGQPEAPQRVLQRTVQVQDVSQADSLPTEATSFDAPLDTAGIDNLRV